MYIHLIIVLVFLAILGFTVADFLREFFKTSGSLGDRLMAAGKGSMTILWTRFCYLVGAVAGLLVTTADYFNAPGVADGIRQVMQPQYVALIGLAVAIITEMARRRTLSQ